LRWISGQKMWVFLSSYLAVRYARLLMDDLRSGPMANPELDSTRTRAHNALIDGLNILSRQAAQSGGRNGVSPRIHNSLNLSDKMNYQKLTALVIFLGPRIISARSPTPPKKFPTRFFEPSAGFSGAKFSLWATMIKDR